MVGPLEAEAVGGVVVGQRHRRRLLLSDVAVAQLEHVVLGSHYVIVGHVALQLLHVGVGVETAHVVDGDVVLVTLAHHLHDAVLVLVVDDRQPQVRLRALHFLRTATTTRVMTSMYVYV